jgi:hypothetical protein
MSPPAVPAKNGGVKLLNPATTVVAVAAPSAVVPPNFQGELKEKCMTFFSSVTRTRKDSVRLSTATLKTRL